MPLFCLKSFNCSKLHPRPYRTPYDLVPPYLTILSCYGCQFITLHSHEPSFCATNMLAVWSLHFAFALNSSHLRSSHDISFLLLRSQSPVTSLVRLFLGTQSKLAISLSSLYHQPCSFISLLVSPLTLIKM